MKKKNKKHKKHTRHKFSKREKRIMRVKRSLKKRAKKLRLSAKRTGAYVFGTLRKIFGNPYTKYGVMLTDVKLLGTGLELKKGERVGYIRATNIPGGGVFVRPMKLRGIWKMASRDDSIYIRPGDFVESIRTNKMSGAPLRDNPGDRGLSPGLRRLEDTFEEYGITNPYLQRKMISRIVMKMSKKKRKQILNSPYGIDTLEKALEGYLKGLYIRSYDETMKSMGYSRVRRNPAIPASMNNPDYVKVLKVAEKRAEDLGVPFAVYAYEGMDGFTFIARKPGGWAERHGDLITLITPKGKKR